MTPERELWSLYEPVHGIVYFDPSISGCLAEIGLHGFWNGYFAGRAAPLGAVGPEPVTALFFGFAPSMVAKAVPKVWGRVTPADAVASRLAAVSRILTPQIENGSTDDVRRVADLMTAAATDLNTDGRALAAAWQGTETPTDLAGRLWWAATVIREHRGDGHVLAATYAELTGLQATITHVADGAVPRELMQPNRGWTDAEWDAAVDQLAARGVTTAEGTALTTQGLELRDTIEAATDRLAGNALAEELPLLRRVLGGLRAAIVEAGALPELNPMGVPVPPAS